MKITVFIFYSFVPGDAQIFSQSNSDAGLVHPEAIQYLDHIFHMGILDFSFDIKYDSPLLVL